MIQNGTWDGVPSSIGAVTTTPFPLSDFIHLGTVVTGSPHVGDGIVGWEFTGTVTPEPTTMALLVLPALLIRRRAQACVGDTGPTPPPRRAGGPRRS